jgi:hypothetical protein
MRANGTKGDREGRPYKDYDAILIYGHIIVGATLAVALRPDYTPMRSPFALIIYRLRAHVEDEGHERADAHLVARI